MLYELYVKEILDYLGGWGRNKRTIQGAVNGGKSEKLEKGGEGEKGKKIYRIGARQPSRGARVRRFLISPL